MAMPVLHLDAPVAHRLPSTPAPAPAATIRVLVADDSAAIRTLARYALSARHGFTVVAEAKDGSEALAMFDTHRPDCVVLDVDMPVMDGFEALDELHRRGPEVPVIMLSGFADQRTADLALRGGAVAYLDKSSQLSSLGDTIRRVTSLAVPTAPAEHSPIASPTPGPTESAAPLTAAADTELQRFEYVVSHDLAEPIRIMSGFANLLQARYADSLDASGQAFLDHIVAAGARGQAMIDDLLTYSRAGRREPEPQVTPLGGLVAAACSQLRSLVADRSAEITIGDLPTAYCDPELTTTIVRELIENAITFNTAAKPTVHLTGAAAASGVALVASDNGIGMAPADCARAVGLFSRLHSRDEFPGTGTGLALCRRLTDLQGGTLVLASVLGSGTTATLTLPATDYLGDRR